MTDARNQPKTIGQALRELEQLGYKKEVAAVRARLNEEQTDFIQKLKRSDFDALLKPSSV